MLPPLIRTSPSSAIFSSTPGNGRADGAELVAVERLERRGGRGLGHAVALEDRDAAGEEELEDLLRDRSGAGDRLAHLAAERGADLREELLLGPVEWLLQLGRDGRAGELALAHLDAECDGRVELLGLHVGRDERVDLLEDARHRREVRRMHLVELDDDLLRVVGPVGERRADIERQELDQQRERVREREVEVGDLVLLQGARRLRHREDRAVIAVLQNAALRRASRAGGVDEGVRVVGLDAGDAALELVAVAAAASRAQVIERDRVGGRALGVDHDHVLELGQALSNLGDLCDLSCVLADDRSRAGVTRDPLALLRRVGRVDRHDDRARLGGAEVGVGPLGTGAAEDRDTVAGGDAEVDEAERDLLGYLADLAVGDVLPGAVALDAQGDAVGVLIGRQRQQVGDRLRAG